MAAIFSVRRPSPRSTRSESRVLLAVMSVLMMVPPTGGAVFAGGRRDDAELHEAAGAAVAFAAAGAFAAAASYPLEETAVLVIPATALGAASAAGALKELIDFHNHGTPELRDLLSTTLGGLAGGLLASAAIAAFGARAERDVDLAVALGMTALATGAALVPVLVRAQPPVEQEPSSDAD